MFGILELLGLCGILGISKVKERHRIAKMNRNYSEKKYNRELEERLRKQIMYTHRRPDGTPLDLNAQNTRSYDYITIQELRKLGYEPSPLFCIFDLKRYKFDEETGAWIRDRYY